MTAFPQAPDNPFRVDAAQAAVAPPSTQAASVPPADPSMIDLAQGFPQAADNPFRKPAQAQASQQDGPPPTSAIPYRLPGILGDINDFGNNLGDAFAHHLENLPLGAAQLVGHGITSAADAALSPDNSVRQAIDGTNANFDNNLKQREQQYQSSVPTNTASIVGAGLGETLPWATGLGELRAAGMIPEATTLTGKLASLAAEGGAMGAGSPVTGKGSFAAQKIGQIGIGAATGPIAYGAGKMLGMAGSGVANTLEHIRNPQAIADADIASRLGIDPMTIAKLGSAPVSVPGEVRSATQVLAGPQSVALDRLMRNNPQAGLAFAHTDIANDAARRNVIQSIAKDDTAYQAAKDTRTAATQPYIDANLTDSMPVTRWSGAQDAFQSVLDNPSRMPSADFDAVKQAQQIVGKVRSEAMQEDDALAEMKDLHASVSTQKAQNAFQSAQSAIDNNMVDPSNVLKSIATIRNGPLGVDARRGADLDALTSSITSGTNIRGMIGTDMLDAVRQQASHILGNATPQSAFAYGPAKNQIVNAIERVSPGYRDYVAAYAHHSQPINDMDAGQKLLGIIDSRTHNAGDDSRATISDVRSALNADSNATYPMSPEARAKVEGVLQSMQSRSVVNNNVGAAGPSTASDLLAANPPKRGSLVFGDPLSGKPGILTRLVGAGLGGTIGTLVGEHIPGGGIPGAIIGSSMGGLLPDAVGKVNAGIASRIGETLADSKKTADALSRVASKSYADPRRTILTPAQSLLFGTKVPRIQARP